MASGELTITSISASGLGQGSPGEDLTKTNPYVLFELGDESHKTKKEKKVSSEVSWDDDTITLKQTSGDVLSVSVVHKRIVHADVVIGKGSITLAELGENGPVQVNLTEPKSGSSAGVLSFSVSGNRNLGYPKTATIKGTTGDAPPAATAGFAGAGAEAHDPQGLKTGRDYPSGGESAAIGAGAAGAAAAGAGAAAAGHHNPSAGSGYGSGEGGLGSGAGAGSGLGSGTGAGSGLSSGTGTGSGLGSGTGTGSGLGSGTGTGSGLGSGTGTGSGLGSGTGTGFGSGTGTGVGGSTETGAGHTKTYTEAAREKAVGAADFTTQKLQDLKVGIVGQQGAARAEGKDSTGEPIVTSGAQASYVDKAKEGAAYLITKTQDALQYTKETVIGGATTGTAGTTGATTGSTGIGGTGTSSTIPGSSATTTPGHSTV